jgi:hypothetical protein
MNKFLGFVVLITFTFFSCASAPVINPGQKSSVQLRVSPFSYPNNGYTNNANLTVKNYEYHPELKATDQYEGSGTEAKKPPSSNLTMTIIVIVGVVAVAGFFIYDIIKSSQSE